MRGLGFWVVGLGQVGGLAGSFELTLKPINTKRFVLHEKHIYIYIYIYLFIYLYIYTYIHILESLSGRPIQTPTTCKRFQNIPSVLKKPETKG